MLKLKDLLTEDAKIYIKPGQATPKGKKIQTGSRGGKYYMGSAAEKAAQDKGKTSQPSKSKPLKSMDSSDNTVKLQSAKDYIAQNKDWKWKPKEENTHMSKSGNIVLDYDMAELGMTDDDPNSSIRFTWDKDTGYVKYDNIDKTTGKTIGDTAVSKEPAGGWSDFIGQMSRDFIDSEDWDLDDMDDDDSGRPGPYEIEDEID